MYIRTVTLFVHDVDRALDFYTRILGWEKRMDQPLQPGSDSRWVTVAPPGEKTEIVLARGFAGWAADKVGGFTGTVLWVDDAEATALDLTAKGVEFTTPPTPMPWGLWAQFKDSEGNEFGLHSDLSSLAGVNV